MSLLQIRGAFQDRLNDWTTDRDTTLRIAWQNVPFTPVTGETYLRVFLLPALTDSQDLEGKHRAYTGIFQINIVCPAGTGSKLVEDIAEELESLFPLNLRMATTSGPVLVYTPMSVGPALPDGGTFTLPVWCRYRMDTI